MSKISLTLMVGIFALLVVYNNLLDYDTNFAYVQHVMSMDTTQANQVLKLRAITNSDVHQVFYWFIIAIELLMGILCVFGSFRLFLARNKSIREFSQAKSVAMCGLLIGFALWFFGFTIIGAEWFQMWQSKDWNGQNIAFRLLVCVGIVMIFLNQAESE